MGFANWSCLLHSHITGCKLSVHIDIDFEMLLPGYQLLRCHWSAVHQCLFAGTSAPGSTVHWSECHWRLVAASRRSDFFNTSLLIWDEVGKIYICISPTVPQDFSYISDRSIIRAIASLLSEAGKLGLHHLTLVFQRVQINSSPHTPGANSPCFKTFPSLWGCSHQSFLSNQPIYTHRFLTGLLQLLHTHCVEKRFCGL